MFDRKFNIILGVFLVLFATVTYMSLSNNRLAIFTRAANKDLDINKSLVILNKLEVVADGADNSTITVFARNSEGVGIINKKVDISSTLGTVTPNSLLTDNYGKAAFTIISSVPGSAVLNIQIDGQPLTTNYSVLFK